MEPKKAAAYATAEIGLAGMPTTLAIIVIFLPVAFMKGLIGRFFLQFALTVVFSVFVSLIVSFTLTPMAASIFMKAHQKRKDIAVLQPSAWQRIMKGWDGFNDRSAAWYRKLLAISLRHRGIVLLIAFVIFVCSLFITKFIGKEFLPPEDQGVFLARLQAPADYSVDQADALFKKAETIMRGLPEVKTVFYIQGYGRTVEVNKAVLFVTLKPKSERQKSQETIKKEIRLRFLEIPGLKGYAEDVSMIGGGQRMVPIQYSIRGTDFSALQTYSKQVVNEFSKLPGIVDVDTSQEATKPELKIYIDRDKAADLGLSVASVAEAVNLLIGGEVDITKYKDEERGRRYDLRVRLNPQDRSNPDDLGRIYVRAQDGRLVEVSNVIRIKEGGGPSVINRLDRQRAVTVFASLEGKPLGQAIQELDAISARILPVDFVPKYKGMAETMGESFRYLLFALVFGIIMAYMVLASQFESFVHPFTVLLSMPLSFIGAFGALFLTGKTINIFSLIGLILLMGIVKKNAILLIDYTNTLRTRGLSRQEAILQAGPVRLRPILMTTFAMVFGMLPVAMGLGEGSETRSPMGIAVIGGLLSSLFLTLVVVPVAYDLFDDVQAFIVRRNRRGLGKTDEKGRSAIEESHSADHDQSASAVLERKSDGSN
jgi:HAE1 family hydrophobic/amphiphilic exporter-1